MLIDEVRASDVVDAKTFARFTQQNFGTPYATVSDLQNLGKQAKDLFANHPNTNWQTLVQVAYWCHRKKRRMARVFYYVSQFRWAYADGAITLEGSKLGKVWQSEIDRALAVETNEAWRARLMRADGPHAQREVLEQWKTLRQS